MRTWAAALDRTRRRECLIASVVATGAVIALLVAAIPSVASGYSATIRRTEGGIPHISARDVVDGMVAGTWSVEKGRVSIRPFEPLPPDAVRQLNDEAARLEAFMA